MRLPLANESKGPRHPTNPGKHAVGSERGNACKQITNHVVWVFFLESGPRSWEARDFTTA